MRRRKQVSVHGGEWRTISQISRSIPFPVHTATVTHNACACDVLSSTQCACVYICSVRYGYVYGASEQNIVVVNKNKLGLERAGNANIKWIRKFPSSSLAIQVHKLKLKPVSLRMKYSHLHTIELMPLSRRLFWVWHSLFLAA